MRTEHKVQLFLLHFAGGSSYSYDFLRAYMDDNFEFIPLEIPGRGKRFHESLLATKAAAIEDYTKQIKKLRNHRKPYLIFGHSMGATLALSIAYEMEKINDIALSIIVSGNPGPGIKEPEDPDNKGPRYLMNDADFKAELEILGGIPEEILNSDELYDFFEPIMRADFAILEKESDYSEEEIKLRSSIYALMGSEEERCEHIENWKKFTKGTFESNLLEGNHFFIHGHPEKLSTIILNSYKDNF
ncbi:Linear gramicidin dehydrogenase LgrE [Kordia antarctica]|uniref:Linear gramicidin dehydrogenase LgrE n=1 Tax=Kordia antarctica TaxID=1218801 RepID=A0A7L4ZGL7_9FLAO|nr:alpha/beta fold hydrolase [Kordia antarctica]QHI35396.1 Linear gramicidin dehydrogenase LgrE [Kordia antarctica]